MSLVMLLRSWTLHVSPRRGFHPVDQLMWVADQDDKHLFRAGWCSFPALRIVTCFQTNLHRVSNSEQINCVRICPSWQTRPAVVLGSSDCIELKAGWNWPEAAARRQGRDGIKSLQSKNLQSGPFPKSTRKSTLDGSWWVRGNEIISGKDWGPGGSNRPWEGRRVLFSFYFILSA